jgi:hypothetical protein
MAMTDLPKTRRDVLLTAALWAGGAVATVALFSARRAGAFEIYEAPATSGLGLAYTNRCGPASEHSAMKVRMQGDLARDSSASSLSEKCPICGCAVTVWR